MNIKPMWKFWLFFYSLRFLGWCVFSLIPCSGINVAWKMSFPQSEELSSPEANQRTMERWEVAIKEKSEQEGVPLRKCLVPWEQTSSWSLFLTKANVCDPRRSLSFATWSLTQRSPLDTPSTSPPDTPSQSTVRMWFSALTFSHPYPVLCACVYAAPSL